MDKKKLMPQQAQPVNRITTGQLPCELAELSEEALSDSASVRRAGKRTSTYKTNLNELLNNFLNELPINTQLHNQQPPFSQHIDGDDAE
ncbi:MAG TPA: hypothetical protein DCY88_09725 [Cyanobacteria bacterium UBA11372]|nr:hypothetical protein [Cyanobacteria bacterium UBA11372]